MMKRKIILWVGILLISGVMAASRAFGASLVQPGFGNGFINTPIAWNSAHGWAIGIYDATAGGLLADSIKLAGSYSYEDLEFSAGLVDYGDKNDTFLLGISGRYNFHASETGFYATVLAGLQRNRNNVADNSTALGALLLGQKFRGGGVSLGAFLWSDAGVDNAGNEVSTDFEATGNIYYDFSDTWSIFGEGYSFADADKAGWSFGLFYKFHDNITGMLAVSGASDPVDDSQIQLGVNFRLQ